MHEVPVAARRRRLAALTAFVAVAAALGFGCGEAGEEDAKPMAPLSRAQFAARADAVCREARVDLPRDVRTFERNRRERGDAGEQAIDMVHFIYLPTVETEASRLRLLRPPRGDGDRIEEILDEYQVAIDSVAVIRSVPTIEAAQRHFTRLDRLLVAYGLGGCAHGPPARQGA